VDRSEVTVDAYLRCGECGPTGVGPYCNAHRLGLGNHPVNCVNWYQADAYCRSVGKRLPTEAEWEYAARGGSRQLDFPWGPEPPDGRACWKRDSGMLGTCPVGSFAPGAYGLLDMAGNVWEWVHDWHAPYTTLAEDNPRGPMAGTTRVFRGGSWLDSYSRDFGYRILSGSMRFDAPPSERLANLGFRCVAK